MAGEARMRRLYALLPAVLVALAVAPGISWAGEPDVPAASAAAAVERAAQSMAADAAGIALDGDAAALSASSAKATETPAAKVKASQEKTGKPKISDKKITLYNSDTYKLKVTGGKGKITWKSSNKKIATVSKKGVVKAKKGGTCTITAKRDGKTMKCKVKVPKHYEGYGIPDFGALYGKTGKYTDSGEDWSTAIVYGKCKKSLGKKYEKKLKKKGFSLVAKESGTKVYMNSDYEMAAFAYSKKHIVVIYGNVWDSYDDSDDDYDDYDDYDY